MKLSYHVYQGVWAPTIGEELPCRKEHGNTQDPYAVAVLDGVNVVGHVLASFPGPSFSFNRDGEKLGLVHTVCACAPITW